MNTGDNIGWWIVLAIAGCVLLLLFQAALWFYDRFRPR